MDVLPLAERPLLSEPVPCVHCGANIWLHLRDTCASCVNDFFIAVRLVFNWPIDNPRPVEDFPVPRT